MKSVSNQNRQSNINLTNNYNTMNQEFESKVERIKTIVRDEIITVSQVTNFGHDMAGVQMFGVYIHFILMLKELRRVEKAGLKIRYIAPASANDGNQLILVVSLKEDMKK